MSEGAAGLFGRYQAQRLVRGLKEGLRGPGLRLLEDRLRFGEGGEGLFYGVEIRRVGGQEPKPAAPLFDEGPLARRFL